jgi:hypothetical protein
MGQADSSRECINGAQTNDGALVANYTDIKGQPIDQFYSTNEKNATNSSGYFNNMTPNRKELANRDINHHNKLNNSASKNKKKQQKIKNSFQKLSNTSQQQNKHLLNSEVELIVRKKLITTTTTLQPLNELNAKVKEESIAPGWKKSSVKSMNKEEDKPLLTSDKKEFDQEKYNLPNVSDNFKCSSNEGPCDLEKNDREK